MIQYRRDSRGSLLGGVSSSIAHKLDCSPWLVRMAWVLAALVSLKITLLVYLVWALVLRLGPRRPPASSESTPAEPLSRVQALEAEFRDLEKRMGGN